MVRPARRMLSAISFGVLRRSAPSTSAIMRSRNDLPGSCVTSITSRSESSFVPPVTAERSPPDSRMTGADSPVIADSSTEPTPSMISPSAGMIMPASTTTTSPRCSSGAATSPDGRRGSGEARSSSSAWRAARRPAPCRAPRRSPRRSSRRARSARARTRSLPTNQSWSYCPRASSRKKITVVITLPSSTMNITGFLNWSRGSSFGNESRIAASTSSREKTLARLARHLLFLSSLSRARLSSSTLTPGSPKKPRPRPSVFSEISFCTVASGRWRTAAMRRAWSCAYAGEMSGIDPRRRGRDRVDRDVVDRQSRVVRALELEDRLRVLRRRASRGRGSSGRG